jgi:Mg2+/Co2+ transporter CorC
MAHIHLGEGSFPLWALAFYRVRRGGIKTHQIALVIEDGDVVGMVTVTDLLKTIIGDIEDSLDQNDPTVLD